MADPNTIAGYIWKRSQELGVDPRLALGIARFEGLNPNTLGAPTFGNPDARGYSFGPYQLYSASPDPQQIAPGGLAYEFKERYGAAPSRENWKEQVDFSLETMKRRGTTPWYAVRDQGGVEAITEKGGRYAAELGLVPGQAAPAAQPAAAPAAPVYANDWTTLARRAGNAIVPDLVAPATPLTPEQAKAQQQQMSDANALLSASRGFLQLANLAAPKAQQEEPMLQPMRPVQARPVQLRRMRGLL